MGSLSVTNSINWDDIIDKPEAFNPIEHIHSIYEINNLQDELDTKADKTDIDDMLTKTEAQDTYQVKGNYLTEHQDISQLATKQEVTEALATKQDVGNYITLETADGKYQIKGDYATKSELANKVDTSVYTKDKATFALKSELPDVSSFITNTVDNLVNYYKKSETYTKSEIDGKINAITTINFEVVGELPVSGEANKIYLVPNAEQGEKNVKDEYIWVDDKWEMIGSTQIDLTNYYTKNEVDTKLSTKLDLSTYNSDKENFVLKIDLEDYITISDAENIYATKSELENKVNNSEIIDMASKTWVKEQNYISSVSWDDINNKPSEYQPIAHEHIINDISDLQEYLSQFTTKTELSDALSLKQDKLISNSNIKTINGESLLGSGNIIIENNEGIPEAPTDNKKYVRQNTNWVEETIINTENFITKNELDTKADKTDIDDMLTKTEAQDTYQVKGNYLTNIPEEYITENELLNKDYTTKTWVQEQGYLTEHQDISNLATKDEVSVSLDNKVDKTVFEETIGMLKIYYKEGYSDSDGYINEEIVTEEEGFQNIIISRMFYDGNMWCNCCSYKNIHDEYKVITGGPKYQTVLLTSPIISYTIPNCLYRVFYIKIPV